MKRFILAVAMAAAAMFTLAATASADVPRYQFQYATLVGNVNNGAFIHTYPDILKINPCNGEWEFGGTGTVTSGSSTPGGAGLASSLTETVTGSFDGSTLVFHSIYSGPYNPGYHWDFTGPLAGGAANSGVYSVVWSMTPSAGPTYANHGAYVEAMGGGDDAAHSCIGKPLKFSFTYTGEVSAEGPTGTTVNLPDSGQYRIDVSGTWHNDSWGDVDAEYAQYLGQWYDGFDHASTGYMLGPNFGDLKVNGQFVTWGAFNPAHTYSLYMTLPGPTLDLGLSIFDGSGNGTVLQPTWYGDNFGHLDFTITYVAP